MDTARHRNEIAALADAAISADVMSDHNCGFVSVMAKSNPNVQQDIPAAFEMYTLLSHYLNKLPFHVVTLDGADVQLTPAMLYDEAAGKVVVLISIPTQELNCIAYWIAGGIRSNKVRAMDGVLALPFSIETHDNVRYLIPEWFAAFYIGGSKDHCVPSLTLQSVTLDERFSDWVALAFARMPMFGLPCATANAAIWQKTESTIVDPKFQAAI